MFEVVQPAYEGPGDNVVEAVPVDAGVALEEEGAGVAAEQDDHAGPHRSQLALQPGPDRVLRSPPEIGV